MEELGPKVSFDSKRAKEMVNELRGSFEEGKTMGYEWRVEQLKAILRMMDEREADFMAALHSDLSKPYFESFLHEISLVRASCSLFFKQLKHWMKPVKVPAAITTYPSTAHIVFEPLGVVRVISA